jgi:ferredoxin
MKRMNPSRIARYVILAAILTYITYESYMHVILGGAKVPSVHALCPYGALESMYALLTTGVFIKKIYEGTLILLAVTVVLAVLFRRSFCGFICPFGALQEFFAKIGQRMLGRRHVMPSSIDGPLRYLKYFILPLTAFMAWYTGELWMSSYDPYSAYAHISDISGAIAEDPVAVVGYIMLAVTLVGSFVYDRFFCKYICPAGAFYGIIGKLSTTRVVRNEDMCIHCKACDKSCPVNIKVESFKSVTSMECINCNECVNACPKAGTLEVMSFNKKMTPMAILLAVTVIFFGTIGIAQVTGAYKVTQTSAEDIAKTGTILEKSELKGSYTIEDSAKLRNITLDEMYEDLGIPNTVPKETMLKNISDMVPEFDLDVYKGEK